MGRIISVWMLIALGIAAWDTVVLARADSAFRTQTIEGVDRAMELAPTNTTYLGAAALLHEYQGEDSERWLVRAAELNPTASAPRVRLGLVAEVRGDAAGAERWLSEAYRVDHQFETRWTLANFYLRQGRADDFWKWMRSALEISYGDRRPEFDLCWRMSSDGAEILSKAIPDREPVFVDYVFYLLDRKHVESVAPVARKLARTHREETLPLYSATDALLDAGRFQEAAELWNDMGRGVPTGLTDSNFERSTADGHGFDWREIKADGVTHLQASVGAGHRIRLSGKQPESVEPLRQFVGGLRSGARYRVRWQARTDGLPEHTGLAWKIAGQSVPLESAAHETEFRAPGDVAILTLQYTRPTGEVRAEGSVDLNNVVIEEIR